MYLKIKHHDNIIKQKYDNQSFQDLNEIVKNKCQITKPFKLAYLDVEQDHITISNDEDLKLGIEELRETTTASGVAGQVPALTIVVVEEGEIAEMPNEFSDILPKDNLFASQPKENLFGMQTEPLKSLQQPSNTQPQTLFGRINQGPETKAPQQPVPQAQQTGGLFSNVTPQQQNHPYVFSTNNQPASSLFSNANTHPQDETAASRGGLFAQLNVTNAQTQQQPAQQQSSLFSNAAKTARNPQPNLFSGAPPQNPTPLFSNGLFSQVPQFALPIAQVFPSVSFDHCRRPGPNSTRHIGIQCDHCRVSPIIGRRYKSLQRPNFDLCGKCINYPQYLHEKFLLLQTHNPNDQSLNPGTFSTVVNYFNSPFTPINPIFIQNPFHIQQQGYHILFPQLRSAFPCDSESQINNFLFQGGYQAYAQAYNDYVRRFHLSRK